MSMKDIKEQEKEQRRNYILDAAEKLFFAKGYDNVSMDEIANELEINKATLYLYFKNKESLYLAIVLRGVRTLHAMVSEGVKNCKNGIKILDAVAIAYVNFVRKYSNYNRAFIYSLSERFAIVDRENTNEDAKEILRLRQDIFDIMCNAIKLGIEEGVIRQDVDPVEMTVFLTWIVHGLTEMSSDSDKILEDRGIDKHQFFEDARDFIHRMFMNTESV